MRKLEVTGNPEDDDAKVGVDWSAVPLRGVMMAVGFPIGVDRQSAFVLCFITFVPLVVFFKSSQRKYGRFRLQRCG